MISYLGECMRAWRSRLVDNAHLKYVGWMLSEALSPAVRLRALQCITALYGGDDDGNGDISQEEVRNYDWFYSLFAYFCLSNL
jgi:hypothetical protein